MKQFFIFFLMSIIIFFVETVNAQWSSNPAINTPICSGVSDRNHLGFSRLISDGAGGAIIAWYDYRNNPKPNGVWVQRIDSLGVVRWAMNGVCIYAEEHVTDEPVMLGGITIDGAGGAIIAWSDYRSLTRFDTYVQRVNATGALQWDTNGVAICTVPGNFGSTASDIVSDGVGGAIITWHDNRNITYPNIYAQRINSLGVIQWDTNGIPVCVAPDMQVSVSMITDGRGGAIIAWEDYRSGTHFDIYAQRINERGVNIWGTDGRQISRFFSSFSDQRWPQMASDGAKGALFAWTYEIVTADVRTQHIDSSGYPKWTIDSARLSPTSGNQVLTGIVNDGNGGAIITWTDYRRNGTVGDIYAQRVGPLGDVQWMPNGLPICTTDWSKAGGDVVSDGAGGAIITWHEYRNVDANIYAQRINNAGVRQWIVSGDSNGVPISTASGNQLGPTLLKDYGGGAIVAWRDYRSASLPPPSRTCDIYAQKVNADGTLGPAGSGFVYQFSSGWNMVSLPLLVTDNHKTTLFPTATSQAFAYQGSYIQKDTLSIGVGFWLKFDSYQEVTITGQVFTIDTIYTKEGWNMIGPSSEPIQASTIISDPPGVSISQLFGYDEIYFTSDTMHPGKGYWVKVNQDCKLIPTSAGLDLAKTQVARIHIVPTSELPPLPPDGLLSNNNIPHKYALKQNYPNPFNPTTSIEFSLPQAGYVTLKVYNILGQEVATLVNEAKSPGVYTVNWAADNNTPGVYFGRLISKGQTKSIKMLLIK